MAIHQVELTMGLEITKESRMATAAVLLDRDYTAAEVKLAADELRDNPELDEKIRYGGSLTAADFRRVIEDERNRTDAGRLFSYQSALAYWDKQGRPGKFPGSLFRMVETDEHDKPQWQLKKAE